MRELSVRQYLHNDGSGLTWGYDKSEADKVIAEKDAKILALDAEVFKEKHHAKLFFDERNYAEAQLRHNKYKRCLALSQEWRNYATFCEMQSYCHNHRGFVKTVEKYNWKEFHAWKCVKRWLAIAEKFKTNSTAQQGKEEVK